MSRTEKDKWIVPPDGRSWAEQPRWRKDFPIDSAEDEYVSRRDFTHFMVLISGALAVGQLWIVAENLRRRRRGEPPVQEIARLSELPIGSTLTFHYPSSGEACLLVRLDETRLVAFEQACTHLSCPVIPRVSEKRFECPCHHGSFDMESGRPIAGPPRRPLARVVLSVVGDKVFATGIA